MDNDVSTVLFLVVASAVAYAIPIMWLKGGNAMTACFSTLFSLITVALYAFLIKGHKVTEISSDTIYRLIISGIMYGIGLILYIEAVKYGKFSLLNLQTILIFIISSVLAFILLGEQTNKIKVIGITVIIIGAILLIYGCH